MSIINKMLSDLEDKPTSREFKYKKDILKDTTKTHRGAISTALIIINILLILSAIGGIYLYKHINHVQIANNTPVENIKVNLPPAPVETVQPVQTPAPAKNITISKSANDIAYEKAVQLYNQHNDKAALQILANILYNTPNNSPAEQLLLTILLQNNKFSEALQEINHYLQRNPQDFKVRHLKPKILLANNNIAAAQEELENLNITASDDQENYELLANIYLQTKEFKAAGDLYEKLLEVDPNNGNFWIGYAVSLDELDYINSAANAYTQALHCKNLKPSVHKYALHRLDQLKG
jgi:tetratricopeptide (TPR) repeat protein